MSVPMPPISEPEFMASGVLLLDVKSKRSVSVCGPVMITKAELDRIQRWLAFHFIIEDAQSASSDEPPPQPPGVYGGRESA